MQRAKVYNLPSTAYFKGVLFVFERSKVLCDELSTLRKNDVFDTNEKFFFSYLNKLFFVNCRALHAASYGIFCFVYESISVDKKKWNNEKGIFHSRRKSHFFALSKTDHMESLLSFEHKKYTLKISFTLFIVELFMLHLLVYFVLFYEDTLVHTKMR